jgi:TonB-dependent starch-binding outer membrane protein SusC
MKRIYESSWADLRVVRIRHGCNPSSCISARGTHSISLKTFLVGLMLILVSNITVAQVVTISGRVTDAATTEPVPGVNVILKGTKQGTVTDISGYYKIVAEGFGGTLVFSFMGMETQEVKIDRQSPIDVRLKSDITQLSEIVVTGTGVPTEKRKLAFAVESVGTEKLAPVPTVSIDQALVGRIAGAQISSINGTPGSEISILLRGINTINRGTMPMILVDGVQMGVTLLSSIDPNTIEKVEVIQGASAATIYGAQGANGVIQLFTKKGKAGKMNIDFSFGMSTNEFLNVGGLRKAKLHGFTTNQNNEVINPGDGSVLSQNDTTLLYSGNVGYNAFDTATNVNKPYDRNLQYFDHLKIFFKPAVITNYSIVISGGGDNIDYNVAMSKMRQESNFRNDGYLDRTNFAVNLGAQVAKGLRLRSVTQLIYNYNTINIWDKQDFAINGNFLPLLTSRPFADFAKKDLDGNYGANFGAAAGVVQFNPYYEFQYASSLDKKIDVIQNLNFSYSFPKYVELDILYGINFQTRNLRHEVQNQSLNKNSNERQAWTLWSNYVDNTGEITVFDNNRTFQNFKATSNIQFDFINDFNWQIPVHSTTQITYDYRRDHLTKYKSYALGMPVSPPLSSSMGTTFNIPEDYTEEFVTFGYLINQRFEYKDLAGISGGFRSDYSSSFGKGSKPFTFPRVDGYFRISGLAAWDDTRVSKSIVEWKLRTAYGEAGIQPMPFDRYVTLGSKALGSTNALYLPREQNNPTLDVEVSKEYEVGTDMLIDVLKGRWFRNIQLSVSYWTRKTDNAIYRVDVAPSIGAGTLLDNSVSLESKGLQASMYVSMLKNSNFKWDLTTNFSKQESLVSAVKGDTIIAGDRIITAGQSVGELYGVLMLQSLDQKKPNGEPFINPSEQSHYALASNGWVVDKDTKQPYLTTEKYRLGNPNPKFMMTFINDFSFRKILTFSFQIDWLAGNKLYNGIQQWMYSDGVHSDYEQPITIDGRSGAWSAFYRGAYAPGAQWTKNYFYEDASFVRLRNISVAIDFASVFRNRLNKVQLVLSGRNLWTHTKYSGMDPEVSTYGATTNGVPTSTLNRGVDDGSRPSLRSYQFTLSIQI